MEQRTSKSVLNGVPPPFLSAYCQYFLRVPPSMKHCREARGRDPEYRLPHRRFACHERGAAVRTEAGLVLEEARDTVRDASVSASQSLLPEIAMTPCYAERHEHGEDRVHLDGTSLECGAHLEGY